MSAIRRLVETINRFVLDPIARALGLRWAETKYRQRRANQYRDLARRCPPGMADVAAELDGLANNEVRRYR